MSSKDEVTARILELTRLVVASSVMTNERIARTLGINVVDLQTLSFIARGDGPVTAGEISARTELPTSTTTRVLDRLEKRGFIERRADPNDRRRVVLHARLEAFDGHNPWAEIVDQVRRLHKDFTLDELRVVERYLDGLKDVR